MRPFAPLWLVALLAAAALPAQDWRPLTPFGTRGTSLAYDSARQCTVLFGGRCSSGPLADTWEYDGTAWRQATTHTFPPPRSLHQLTYDSQRQRVVLFGGQRRDGTPLAETWEYDGRNWTQVATTTSPPARIGHALAYDGRRGRTVLFGGTVVANSQHFGDTWEYDGTAWQQRSTASSPSARVLTALAYDAALGRTVLFGGADNTAERGDTWHWDGAVWVQVLTAGPPVRVGHAMAFDSARNRTLVVGGERASVACTDTWEWDGANWTQGPGITPPAGAFFGVAYDQARGAAVLFATGTWERPSSNATWAAALPRVPKARGQLALAYDWSRSRTVLFGGGGGSGPPRGDTWEWDGSSWHEMTVAVSPPARWYHAMAHDLGRNRTLLFGGWSATNLELADTWEWDGTSWTQRFPAQSPPPRRAHAMSYDWLAARTLLFGGGAPLPTIMLADTWEWDGTNWTQRFPTTGPGARQEHVLAYDLPRNRSVLFGGTNRSNVPLAETWEWDGTSWTQVVGFSPPSRQGSAMVYDFQRARMVLFGGGTVSVQLADTWQYDGSGWTQLPTRTSPAARIYHAMSYDASRRDVVLHGGVNQGDTWELLMVAASCTPHGDGCPGSAGTPVLGALAGAVPALGSAFALELTSLPMVPGLCVFAFGTELVQWNGTSLPMSLAPLGLPGCRLHVAPSPGGSVAVPHQNGAARLSFAIPNNAALAGWSVGAQALVFDGGAPGGFGALSNGVILLVN